MRIHPVDTSVDTSDATLVAGVLKGLEPIEGSGEAIGQADADAFAAAGFEGKAGQTIIVSHPEAAALLVVGLGDELSFRSLRDAAGNAVRAIKTTDAVSLLGASGIEGATRAVVEGTLLGAYEYRTYKTGESDLKCESVGITSADDKLAEAISMSEATSLARDWVNTPAMDKSPETLAGLAREAVGDLPIEVEIWDRSRIESEELGGVLGVAAGSDRDPRVVIMKYRPDGAQKHLALVGKGIIFDTGGLSLKPSNSMEEMKDDMSGAAVVMATTIGIAELGLGVNITTIAPLTDNAVGGNATRPGDVLRPVDGPTIEVLNTDAEGRLILADGLGLAQGYEPDLTIDVATLTGAAAVALGKEVAAVFASDEDVASQVLASADVAGEYFWELPLHRGYRKLIDSNIADIKNVSGIRYGGAIVAALFLAEYAGDGPWAHLDIAGPARSQKTTGQMVKGASGVGVRTLIELARDMAETD